MRVSITPVSSNRKTGPITVTRTEKESCPTYCALWDVCYGKGGPSYIHWNRVEEEGMEWDDFCGYVQKMPKRKKWRHDEVGDLPVTKSRKIDKRKMRALAKAAKHTMGMTYTHHTPADNAEIIAEVNKSTGFTINLSANTPQQADEYHQLGIAPVVVTLPEDAPMRGLKTPNGLPILTCVNELDSSIQCERCKWCWLKDRKFVVGFHAHGVKKRQMSALLNELQANG